MMGKKTYKMLAVVAAGGVMLGCLPCGCNFCNPCGWITGLGSAALVEFLLDNDAVFDLFQDDFGTGTQYDDRFTADPTRSEPDEDTQALVDAAANR
jgi:hypothetical protein